MELDDILARFWGPGIESCNRLELMLDEVDRLPSAMFWPVFQEVWPTCDSTWAQQEALLDLLRFHQPCQAHLGTADREFFASLPDIVSLYRGCSRDRLLGLSWSTDRAIAETFARGHRGIYVPDPIVAEAQIAKTWILAVSTARGESEILIDPDALESDEESSHLRIHPVGIKGAGAAGALLAEQIG